MPHYACNAQFQTCRIIENLQIADDTFRIRIESQAIARETLPGQFVMLRIHGCNDPLIGRAFALYDRYTEDHAQWQGIDLVYLVKGKFTQALSRLSEDDLVAMNGPLGNTFSVAPVDHLVMAVGGVGQTPMLAVGREALGSQKFGNEVDELIDGEQTLSRNGYAKKVTLLYGARTAGRLAGIQDFRNAGFDVRLATDDGSIGEPKPVTDLLLDLLEVAPATESIRIVCCGPEPMMAAVSAIAKEKNISCEVSLETPMACGIGICFSCVAKIRQTDGQWDYQRTCVEGPIFDSAKLVW
ncbi:MAG: dihydroorotate dehydrogenase electron transfer subunit [Planctomycetota bacterium]|nr:dihydroorotate dehydrogenase electron transfer subunit [Planctomycetota bacterium]